MSVSVDVLNQIIADLLEAHGLIEANVDSLVKLAEAMEDDTLRTQLSITLYSQYDPRWAGQAYAGGYKFALAGCYTVAVAMVASAAGYTDTPPEVAAKMRNAGCFSGGALLYPHNIPKAYPRLVWGRDAYWNRSGNRVSDNAWKYICDWIEVHGCLILKVDYKPENYLYDMHFVLAVEVMNDGADLLIVDPLGGQHVSLLERYGDARGWDAQQAVFGYRALRLRMEDEW